ncbi:I78 family peptidase inhibitor [Sphingosinicella sp. LHD-64]|uniref:I78 family peptidase inhibitor n=1 Tax=Sphingosinicella sp. LHD-64 TaxID=3072139 RepID=UPI00280F7094|nr:I78 family peptidase inhibitor [Sphingosinicella sp. LHD-64]MDQ8754868.1 I78 family peptidase inhibitor [Sphingosinicella sp. LHD-64]
MKAAVTALAMMTVACTTTPPEEGGNGGPGGAQRCNADGLQSLVGQPGTPELGAQAQQRSNARTLRWIRPGDAVTMDYREDRLNIELDAEGKVARFNCG